MKIFIKAALALPLLFLTGCLGDDDSKEKSEWRDANDKFVTEQENLRENGKEVYTKVYADWMPGNYILMRWHNDRAANTNVVTPLFNSTVNVIYDLRLCDGKALENSFRLTTNGDSIYQTQPSKNIPGFALALTQMHVGDTCTVIIPQTMAYGNIPNGSIPAYSALIYGLKLKKIVSYESIPE